MNRPRFSRLSRRDLMKLGLVGTGYIVIRADGSISRASDFTIPPSPFTTPFVDELPFPGLTQQVEPFDDYPDEYKFWIDPDNETRFFKIAAEERVVRFHKELLPTVIWGYLDLSPEAEPTVGAGSLEPLIFVDEKGEESFEHILGPTLVQRFGELGPRNRNVTSACPRDPSAPPAKPVGGGFVVRHYNYLPKDHRGFGVP